MLNGQLRQMDAFNFPSHSVDLATGEASFDYALTGPGGEVRFTEVITFPLPASRPDDTTLATFGRVLELLHLVAGVSYYKAAAPRRLVLPKPLGEAAVALVTAIYTKGLAEYAFRNDLPYVLELVPEVPAGEVAIPAAYDNSARRPLSAVGGGKDSIVSLEALRAAGLDPVPFSVNPNRVIVAVNEASGLSPLAARRRIDPALFELNAAGARNGHIPVTAINSLIAVATSVLHGLGPVVMSNERSASDPNLVWNGHEINHQWSKGVEAEGLLRAALAGHAGLTEPYFSLLRQLSELHIARLFARHTRYDNVVTSCNAAFKLHNATARWCGNCPKCRFVFLALAPFMPRERLAGIFGADLLADPAQVPGYLELLGIDAHKPFECVGEVEESLVALGLLAEQEQWRDAPVVRALVAAVPPEAWATASRSDVFTPSGPHYIPPTYSRIPMIRD
ncbi:UDP-N-acetyl-alpha-D-muramoyl-L-alanyl-L-glutamat e epimerase [Micromonospora sonneratiae]|uniref:UDP-N-acetyl-alpha-D-muramoyl-L-alanyl-L-glutamate epimerase n=1 Tax=Micromonospora sonneratiae TaxID=1184706 RepID=A0ABW3YLE1_9ACTN